jgi:hypothetical protein
MKRVLMAASFALALAVGFVAYAAKPVPSAGSFPGAGLDIVTHQVVIDLWKVGPNGENQSKLETLKFEGRMLIERRDPRVNAQGFRQIDFVVKNWEAFAYSNTLDTLVTYKLTEGVPQKLSSITAQQRDRDFPAHFRFNVTFDAIAYGEAYAISYTGQPDNPEFYEVPPSGNRAKSPTLRGFESTRIEMDHPQLGKLRFVPVECNDSSGTTIATYGAKTPKV